MTLRCQLRNSLGSVFWPQDRILFSRLWTVPSGLVPRVSCLIATSLSIIMSLFCGPCQGLIFFYSSCLLHKVKNEVLWTVCFLLKPFSLASIWSCLHMLVPLCASTPVPLLVCLNFLFSEGHQSDCIRAHFVCMCARSLSRVQLFETPWTLAHQAPPFMKFSSQEYLEWFGIFCSGDLPDPGIKPVSPACAGRFFITEPPEKPRAHSNSLF